MTDHMEMPFTSLKQHIDKLEEAVDKCFTPSIYVQTYKIASIVTRIGQLKLTESQENVLKKLDEKALKQFERISKGRCSCKVSEDI